MWFEIYHCCSEWYMILKYIHSTIQFINCVMKMFMVNPKGRKHAYPLRGQGKVITFEDFIVWPEKASVGSSQEIWKLQVQRAVERFVAWGLKPRICEAKIIFTHPLLVLKKKKIQSGRHTLEHFFPLYLNCRLRYSICYTYANAVGPWKS